MTPPVLSPLETAWDELWHALVALDPADRNAIATAIYMYVCALSLDMRARVDATRAGNRDDVSYAVIDHLLTCMYQDHAPLVEDRDAT